MSDFKKTVAFLMCTAVVFSFVACAEKDSGEQSVPSSDTSTSELISSESTVSSEAEISSETSSEISSEPSSSSKEASSSKASSSSGDSSSSKTTSSQASSTPSSSKDPENDIGKTKTDDAGGFTVTLNSFKKISDTEYQTVVTLKPEPTFTVGDAYKLNVMEHLFLVNKDKEPVYASSAVNSNGENANGTSVPKGQELKITVTYKTESSFKPAKFRYLYDERGFKKIEFAL